LGQFAIGSHLAVPRSLPSSHDVGLESSSSEKVSAQKVGALTFSAIVPFGSSKNKEEAGIEIAAQ